MTNQMALNGLDDPKPHFVLVPWMAQGHIIPMIDLGRVLAERGVLVTLITTPVNASRIKTIIDRSKESELSIRFVPLRFPCAELGLPEGCENVDLVDSIESGKKFFKATNLLAQPLETYLREQQQPYPSCIIGDSCHPWTQTVARNLQVPRLSYYGICCFTLLCELNIFRNKVYDRITNETEPFMVPGLSHDIEVTKAQAPGFFGTPGWEDVQADVMEAELAADGVVVNSFQELEPWYVENYQKAKGQKVWTVGPLSLYNKDVADMAARGNKASIDKNRCLSWLDSMKPKSVVYLSFGTLTHTPPSQIIEIGLGLEASNHPFIWVIKDAERSPEVETWLSEGFEERISGRGLIIKGWAPQMMILSHTAVGGLVTHCGWNSMSEGVSAGLPMITWPHFADQFLNEKLMVDVLGIGVGVGVKAPSEWGDENKHVYAMREDVEKAVRSLMDDEGEEGEERRRRAEEFGEKARRAMREGGSSYVNLTNLIQTFSDRD